MKGNARANEWHPWKGATVGVARQTRQQERAMLRSGAFREITNRFSGELRATRRSMAIDKGNREYRNAHGLIERTK